MKRTLVIFAENFKNMYHILLKLIGKIGETLSTFWGCLGAAIVFLFNLFLDFVAGFESIIFITLFSVFLDAAWGIARAIKFKRYTKSSLLRESGAKLSVYGSLLLVFIGLDHVIQSEDGVTTIAAGSLIILTETWSILANAIIVCPNMPFAILLKVFVSGEIASKLNCTKEEVEDILTEKKGKK